MRIKRFSHFLVSSEMGMCRDALGAVPYSTCYTMLKLIEGEG